MISSDVRFAKQTTEERRLFIGFQLPILPRLVTLRNELKQKLPENSIKWTAIENWHITLLYLGSISSKDIPLYQSIIKKVAENNLPFTSSVSGIGVFPFSKQPRVLWSGLSPSRNFLTIFESLKKEMTIIGKDSDHEVYHPHITLARIKHPLKLPLLKQQIIPYEHQRFGEIEIGGITLFESILLPKGAVYKILYEIPF